MLKSANITEGLCLYRSGHPFFTSAIERDLTSLKFEKATKIDNFTLESASSGSTLSLKLGSQDRIFGLGENLGSLNRRGRTFRLFAKDASPHLPETRSLYGSHPVVFLDREKSFGFFLDYPGEILVDAGFRDKNKFEIKIPSNDFDLYLFECSSFLEFTSAYLNLTGKPYLPPRWAFGYQQCRYSYPDEKTVREIAQGFKESDIPCDAIYIDIDYMDGYKSFTVNREAFPDLKRLSSDLKEQGIRIVSIIDPGIKIEPGYSVYEQGKSGNHFCKDGRGKDFVAAVWPGLVHLPDFFDAKCRKWWAGLHRELLGFGISGVWDDMNEPALFYTPDGLNGLKVYVDRIADLDSLGTDCVKFISDLGSFWLNESYLNEFFHQCDDGKVRNHLDLHNLYGFNMVKATAQGLAEHTPEKRPFVLTRSSYPGAHRIAAVWTGDNSSWWEHMLEHIRMMISLNMLGFYFCGADIGGFIGDASADLVIRWNQLGVFTPLFRNHSVKGSRSQEPFAFDPESTRINRDIIRLRYSFLPHIYSEYLSARDSGQPVIAPLFAHFNESRLKEIEDQFMVGSSIAVAPVITSNSTGRFVGLPAENWLHWNASSFENREMRVIAGGDFYLNAGLSEFPIFFRENSIVPLVRPANSVDALTLKELTFVGLVTTEANYELNWDDGLSLNANCSQLKVKVSRTSQGLKTSISIFGEKKLFAEIASVNFEIYDLAGSKSVVTSTPPF